MAAARGTGAPKAGRSSFTLTENPKQWYECDLTLTACNEFRLYAQYQYVLKKLEVFNFLQEQGG